MVSMYTLVVNHLLPGKRKGLIMNVWAIVICVIAVVIIGAIEVWIRLKH